MGSAANSAARAASACMTSAIWASSPSAASRTQRRKSVATWSLRLRAGGRRLPGPPGAAGGVKALAGLADAVGEPGLDVHVDVFEFVDEGEAACFDLGGDGVEAGG